MTFEEAKAKKAELEAPVRLARETLARCPRIAIGLTEKDYVSIAAYVTARERLQYAQGRLLGFNSMFALLFAKELVAERNNHLNS